MARKAFEKEQQRYEKYMEKKRIKELKKERELLEKQLQHHSEEAGLVSRSGPKGFVFLKMHCLFTWCILCLLVPESKNLFISEGCMYTCKNKYHRNISLVNDIVSLYRTVFSDVIK